MRLRSNTSETTEMRHEERWNESESDPDQNHIQNQENKRKIRITIRGSESESESELREGNMIRMSISVRTRRLTQGMRS